MKAKKYKVQFFLYDGYVYKSRSGTCCTRLFFLFFLITVLFDQNNPFLGVYCRFDKANKKRVLNGYFLWLSIGYGVGEYTCSMVMY